MPRRAKVKDLRVGQNNEGNKIFQEIGKKSDSTGETSLKGWVPTSLKWFTPRREKKKNSSFPWGCNREGHLPRKSREGSWNRIVVAGVAGWLRAYGKWKKTGIIIVSNAADKNFKILQSGKKGSVEDNSIYSTDLTQNKLPNTVV